MAAGILPPPGTELGPCLQECEHTDCEATRSMASAVCSLCGEPIGYDVRLFALYDSDAQIAGYVHALCHEQEVEAMETAIQTWNWITVTGRLSGEAQSWVERDGVDDFLKRAAKAWQEEGFPRFMEGMKDVMFRLIFADKQTG